MKLNARTILTIAGLAVATCVLAASLPAIGAVFTTLSGMAAGSSTFAGLSGALGTVGTFLSTTAVGAPIISTMASFGAAIVSPIASAMGAIGFSGTTATIAGTQLTTTGAGLTAIASGVAAMFTPKLAGGVGGAIDHVASKGVAAGQNKIREMKDERAHQKNVERVRESAQKQYNRKVELANATIPDTTQVDAKGQHRSDNGHDFSYLGDSHPGANNNGRQFTDAHSTRQNSPQPSGARGY